MTPSPPPWPKLESEPGPELIVARARFDLVRNPRTGEALRRVVLECPDWVNVVALTPEREVVLVSQYRFGREEITHEIPGGVVDPGEDPRSAAERELREETGFTSTRWSKLATIAPNPAYQSNLCHQYLALDAVETHALEPDPGEDIRVSTCDEERLAARVRSGEIDHSLVLCALARVFDLRG